MKNLLLLFTLFFLTMAQVKGQDEKSIDKLYHKLKASDSDTDKIKAMYQLADSYFKTNMDSALFFASKAYKESRNIQYKKGIIIGYSIFARALIHKNENQKSIQISQEGLQYINKLLKNVKTESERLYLLNQKAVYLKNLGIAYDFSAIYPEALKYYTQALKLELSLGNMKNSAGNYHNIGGIYMDLERYDEALSYFFEALKINQKMGNKAWMANNLANIATSYSYKFVYDSALTAHKKALALFEEEDNLFGKLITLSNIGTMYISMGIVDSALHYTYACLELNKEIGDPRIEQSSYVILGKVFTESGNLKKAREMLKIAGSTVDELGDFGLMEDYYFAMYELDSAQGNFSDALKHYKLSIMYRDSVHNLDNVRKLTQTQLNYDFDKKETEAKAIQEKKDAVAQKELQRQKLVRNTFIAGFAVVLMFAGVFFAQRNRISKEKARSEELLLNILPAEVAEELKEKGSAEAKLIDEVTVLFTDFKGFTQLSEKLTPQQLVAEINECFSAFDLIMQKHGIEKIKTIGDAYMAAGGLPSANETHPFDVINAALEIQQYMHDLRIKKESKGDLFFEIRIGVHTGPVVAGIVGIKKFAYDIWGDTVNTASRMESNGEAGRVNISENTYQLIQDKYVCIPRGKIQAKGKGEIDMYFVEGRKV